MVTLFYKILHGVSACEHELDTPWRPRPPRPWPERWRRGGSMPLDQAQAGSQALGILRILARPQVLEQAPCFPNKNPKKFCFLKQKFKKFSFLVHQKMNIYLPCLRGKELDGCRECTVCQCRTIAVVKHTRISQHFVAFLLVLDMAYSINVSLHL